MGGLIAPNEESPRRWIARQLGLRRVSGLMYQGTAEREEIASRTVIRLAQDHLTFAMPFEWLCEQKTLRTASFRLEVYERANLHA